MSPSHTVSSINAPVPSYSPSRWPVSSYEVFGCHRPLVGADHGAAGERVAQALRISNLPAEQIKFQ